MDNYREPTRTNCCCFKIEECGIFVAWTSLIFGLLYFAACVRDIVSLIYGYYDNAVYFYILMFVYTIHALRIVSSFTSIRRAITEQNHTLLHGPIGVYVVGLFVVFIRYSNVWYLAWNEGDDGMVILAGVLGLITIIIFTFMMILIKLHKHLKLNNITSVPQTSQFIIQRVPPPGYNTQIEIQPQQQYNPYVIGERQSEYNPQFMAQPPPPYNPEYVTQPQNSFSFGTGRSDLDKY